MSPPRDEEKAGPRPAPAICSWEHFQSQYLVLRTIGHGCNAQVKLAHHRLTGTPVAIKVLMKERQWCPSLVSEADIMMSLSHPNIISLLQVIETEHRIYLVMELAEGEQLLRHIYGAGCLQEGEARAIFVQILSAVGYCHAQGITHRDLKPDNIMIDPRGHVKVIDFGLGVRVQPGGKLERHCGAYQFGAPERFLGLHYDGPKADVWTLGVVLYLMVTGKMPFAASTLQELREQVLRGLYDVPDHVSRELRCLLTSLLTPNPQFRPTVKDVQGHPWLMQASQGPPSPWEHSVPAGPDPTIIAAMSDIGFAETDIRDSLLQRKCDETMACYYLLEGQARGGDRSTPVERPFCRELTLFPSAADDASVPLPLRRWESQPKLLNLSHRSAQSHLPEHIQGPGQKVCMWATLPAMHFCYPEQCKPTGKSVCMFSTNNSGAVPEDRAAEEQPLSDGPCHSGTEASPRGLCRRWKNLATRIGNGLSRLCCLPGLRKLMV